MSEPRRRRRASGGALVAMGAAAALLSTTASCADTVRPVLGGLKIGPAIEGPFVMPALLNDRLPFEYPEDAWIRGVGGETLLRIHIASTGYVDSVAVARSSGDRALDSASIAGARLLRYRPARRGDMPVAVWGFLPIRYPLPETAATSDTGPR